MSKPVLLCQLMVKLTAKVVFREQLMILTDVTGNPRHDHLLSLIAERGYMNIDELAVLLDVSTQTVRRDIRKLSEQGLITRHHGGAGPRIQRGQYRL